MTYAIFRLFQVKTVNYCNLTSPLVVSIAVALFSILYIYLHGILVRILWHVFLVRLAFLYQTEHQEDLHSRKLKATNPFSYTLTENNCNKNIVISRQVTAGCAVKLLAINLSILSIMKIKVGK